LIEEFEVVRWCAREELGPHLQDLKKVEDIGTYSGSMCEACPVHKLCVLVRPAREFGALVSPDGTWCEAAAVACYVTSNPMRTGGSIFLRWRGVKIIFFIDTIRLSGKWYATIYSPSQNTYFRNKKWKMIRNHSLNDL